MYFSDFKSDLLNLSEKELVAIFKYYLIKHKGKNMYGLKDVAIGRVKLTQNVDDEGPFIERQIHLEAI